MYGDLTWFRRPGNAQEDGEGRRKVKQVNGVTLKLQDVGEYSREEKCNRRGKENRVNSERDTAKGSG